MKLENTSLDQLGQARQVVVARDFTEIAGGMGDPSTLEAYIERLRQDLVGGSTHDHDKGLERIARLAGRIVTIHAGGKTTQDIRTNRYRLESAMHSLAAAQQRGVVLGAGVSLFHAAQLVFDSAIGTESEIAGYRAVASAMKRPMKVLISSTGADVDAIMKAILEGGHPRLGYNAQTRQVVDVQEDGILDATELVIRAIELAVDLARTFLETASWQSSKS